MGDGPAGRSVLHDPVVAKITAALGRPLRVLHIGNIANNAYNNACIQRQYGIEADVCCHDYYHVMATPEWEDGGLTTKVDPYLPNWWESNLGGFRRPEWYVQGPLGLCIDYLDALRRRQPLRLSLVRARLQHSYLRLLKLDAALKGRPWRKPTLPRGEFWSAVISAAAHISRCRSFVVSRLMGASYALQCARDLAGIQLAKLRLGVVWPLLAAAAAEPQRLAGGKGVIAAYRRLRRLSGKSDLSVEAIRRMARENVPAGIETTWLAAGCRALAIAATLPLAALLCLLAGPAAWLNRKIWGLGRDEAQCQREARADRLVEALLEVCDNPAAHRPEIKLQLRDQIAGVALRFRHVLEHYDIVQGYSIDGLIPLANGFPAFASYEHGTLRDIPFEPSLNGVIASVVYRHSPAVFVTNTDVLPSVARLRLASDRVYYLPHAFDDEKLARWRKGHPELAPPRNEVVLFSPTRHHWRDANPSLTKGNDIMLQAAGRLWRAGRRFRLVMIDWGQDVAESRKLIADLGFTEAVEWLAPMGKQDLWKAYCCSHAVLDQFIVPALGGVGFETLALGRRLVTHTDREVLERFFGAAPPTFAAGNVDEVAASLASILDDPDDTAGIGPSGRDWIRNYHSARRTVSLQAAAYAVLLGDRMERGRAA